MRRVAFVLGALLALGVGAGLLASRRDASTGDADDRAAPGTEPPAATASTMLRPSEPAIDLVGGPTPRRDAAPDADAPEERAGPAPARRTTRILVTSERGGEVGGLEIRRVASPYGPASEARDASIRVDVRRVGADVEFLDDGPPLHLGLRAPGRATEVVVARSDRTTLVPLLASRVVEGVVLEEGSERPAPDVTLVPDPSFRGESWLLPASSGPDGRFRLDLPLRGVTRVIADPGAGAARFVDLPGPAAPTADLVIHVVRRVSLGGRVLVGGVPVAGAILRSLDPYGPLHETRTDASGAYLVPRLPEGFLSVEVDLGVERGGRVRRTLAIRGDDRGHAEEEFSIEAPWTISGRVTSRGRGVPDARVVGAQNTPGAERGATETVTAADGTFVVRGLFSTRPAVFLGVTTPERVYAETSVAVDPVAREARNVAIEIPARARLSGRVLDREGRPIPGVRVGVVPDRFDREPWTTADADGRYVLLVAPGPVSIYARAVGFAPGEASWPSVRDADVGDVVLARGGRVTGRVVDEAARPVVSAYVSCLSDDRTVKSTFVQTDADGAFTIGPVAGTSLRLAVTRYDLGFAQKDVAGVAPDSIVPDIVLVK